MTEFVKVAEVGDLKDGEMRVVEIGEERIVVARVGQEYLAFNDECTHAWGSLSDGDLDGERVTCPLHGSVFNIRSGEVVEDPADEPVKVYPVTIEGNEVRVGVG